MSARCKNRRKTDTWDDYDSLFYNAWLNVDIKPTRFIDEASGRRLGIRSDLMDMIEKLGLGTMATRPYYLYVDLVRQLMATTLSYITSTARVAGDVTLSFFVRRIRYVISITDLCDIYGRDPAAATSTVLEFANIAHFGRYSVHASGTPVPLHRQTSATRPYGIS